MILEKLFANERNIALLIDPDKVSDSLYPVIENHLGNSIVSSIFIGGSLVFSDTDVLTQKIKQFTNLPVLLFPGNVSQLNKFADGVMLLSLISGRNPEFLIGQHVIAAPIIRRLGLNTIPTGYMLFDCGCVNSVRYISGTLPIPNDKPDIAVATAIAGEMLGMKTLYLEAGSGAKEHVSLPIIKAVKEAVKIPIIVGGGLNDIKDIENVFESGADLVVVGTAFEKDPEMVKNLHHF